MLVILNIIWVLKKYVNNLNMDVTSANNGSIEAEINTKFFKVKPSLGYIYNTY